MNLEEMAKAKGCSHERIRQNRGKGTAQAACACPPDSADGRCRGASLIDFNDIPIVESRWMRGGARIHPCRPDCPAGFGAGHTMFPCWEKAQGKIHRRRTGQSGRQSRGGARWREAGLWTDRATGDGGDIFTLIGGHFGIDVHADFHRVLEQSSDLRLTRPVSADTQSQIGAPVDDLGPPRPSGTTWTPVVT